MPLELTAIEPYMLRRNGSTNAATAVLIADAPVLPGSLVWVKNVGVYNNSGETITVQVGITDVGGFFPVTAQNPINDGDAYGLVSDFWLREGDALTTQVTGTAKHGRIVLFGSGLYFAKVRAQILPVALGAV